MLEKDYYERVQDTDLEITKKNGQRNHGWMGPQMQGHHLHAGE